MLPLGMVGQEGQHDGKWRHGHKLDEEAGTPAKVTCNQGSKGKAQGISWGEGHTVSKGCASMTSGCGMHSPTGMARKKVAKYMPRLFCFGAGQG